MTTKPHVLIGDSALREFGPVLDGGYTHTFTGECWRALNDHLAQAFVADMIEREKGRVYRHPDVVIEFLEPSVLLNS